MSESGVRVVISEINEKGLTATSDTEFCTVTPIESRSMLKLLIINWKWYNRVNKLKNRFDIKRAGGLSVELARDAAGEPGGDGGIVGRGVSLLHFRDH